MPLDAWNQLYRIQLYLTGILYGYREFGHI
jgi:hypothetical protein